MRLLKNWPRQLTRSWSGLSVARFLRCAESNIFPVGGECLHAEQSQNNFWPRRPRKFRKNAKISNDWKLLLEWIFESGLMYANSSHRGVHCSYFTNVACHNSELPEIRKPLRVSRKEPLFSGHLVANHGANRIHNLGLAQIVCPTPDS